MNTLTDNNDIESQQVNDKKPCRSIANILKVIFVIIYSISVIGYSIYYIKTNKMTDYNNKILSFELSSSLCLVVLITCFSYMKWKRWLMSLLFIISMLILGTGYFICLFRALTTNDLIYWDKIDFIIEYIYSSKLILL